MTTKSTATTRGLVPTVGSGICTPAVASSILVASSKQLRAGVTAASEPHKLRGIRFNSEARNHFNPAPAIVGQRTEGTFRPDQRSQ